MKDGDGKPVAAALIRGYDREPGLDFVASGQIDFDKVFGGVWAVADGEGRYTLKNVTPGKAWVFAQKSSRMSFGQAVPHAHAVLEVPEAQEVEWNPVIADGRTIEGIVRYRDGPPIRHVFLTLSDERTNKRSTTTNDREGRFKFVNLDDSTYSIRVQIWDAPKDAPPVQKSGVEPDRGPVELVASFDKPVRKSNGTVIGRVDDAGGRIKTPKDAHVVLQHESGWFRDNGKLTNGNFKFDRVEPGRIHVSLIEGETLLAHSDWHTLEPGAMLDTGVLRTLPGGALQIRLDREKGTEAAEPRLSLRRKGDRRGTSVKMGRDSERLVENLTPGDYFISGFALGTVSMDGRAMVTAGATTEVRLEVRLGTFCSLEAWFPPEHDAGSYTFTVTNLETGEVQRTVNAQLSNRPTRPLQTGTSLPPGRWRIAFTAGDLAGSTDLDLDGKEPRKKVRIDLAKK